ARARPCGTMRGMPVMKRVIALSTAAFLAAWIAACGKDDKASSAAPVTAGSGPIGVRECDAFVKQYEVCMSKLPQPQKGAMEATLAKHREDFRKKAEGPDKAKLRDTCKELLDQVAKNPQCQ